MQPLQTGLAETGVSSKYIADNTTSDAVVAAAAIPNCLIRRLPPLLRHQYSIGQLLTCFLAQRQLGHAKLGAAAAGRQVGPGGSRGERRHIAAKLYRCTLNLA